MGGRLRFVLVALAVAVLATPAAATATVSSSPASSWQTNGRVRAVVVAAHKIFIGGDFTMVRAPGASSGGVARNHLAALSVTTGKLMPWNPRANGTVTALRVNSAGTTIYIGGGFTTISGKSRVHLAAVSTTETKLREWHANTDGTVYAIATTRKPGVRRRELQQDQGLDPPPPGRARHVEHRATAGVASQCELDRAGNRAVSGWRQSVRRRRLHRDQRQGAPAPGRAEHDHRGGDRLRSPSHMARDRAAHHRDGG